MLDRRLQHLHLAFIPPVLCRAVCAITTNALFPLWPPTMLHSASDRCLQRGPQLRYSLILMGSSQTVFLRLASLFVFIISTCVAGLHNKSAVEQLLAALSDSCHSPQTTGLNASINPISHPGRLHHVGQGTVTVQDWGRRLDVRLYKVFTLLCPTPGGWKGQWDEQPEAGNGLFLWIRLTQRVKTSRSLEIINNSNSLFGLSWEQWRLNGRPAALPSLSGGETGPKPSSFKDTFTTTQQRFNDHGVFPRQWKHLEWKTFNVEKTRPWTMLDQCWRSWDVFECWH